MRSSTILQQPGEEGADLDHVGKGAKDAYWVCGTGYMTGKPAGGFMGIPATGRPLRIRWGEFIRFQDDEMIEAQVIIDFIDWFDQVGLASEFGEELGGDWVGDRTIAVDDFQGRILWNPLTHIGFHVAAPGSHNSRLGRCA